MLFCSMGSDGMTIDDEGNVYLTGNGVTIFNQHGEEIVHVDVGASWTANVTFGGIDRKTLFITAQDSLYGLRMRVKWASVIPDFNCDGKVDLADFSRLAAYWHEDEWSVDIGPTPFGDRTVDIRDVAVLADYWLNEVLPIDLVAYWKLDETEGTIANDSLADNDGILNGNPVWDPDSGKFGGALQFDGIDDYVSTPFILDPSAGAFSVFTWVKGRALGVCPSNS
jgi:hypothetical protein